MSDMDIQELRRLLAGLPDGMQFYDLADLAKALRAVQTGDLGKPPAPRHTPLSLNDETQPDGTISKNERTITR